MTHIDELFNRAIQLHQTGELSGARRLYEQILGESPGHAKTLNLLGASYLQAGEHRKGLPFIEKALALNPDFPEACNNLGIALKGLERHEEAAACFRKAATLKPDYALAHYNLGIALKELKRHEEAAACFRKTLSIKPDYAEAYNSLGIVLSEIWQHEEATACFQSALALKPGYANGHNNLGIALSKMRRHEKAVACFHDALAIRPDYADAYSNLGIALTESRRHREAAACYQKLLSIKPDYAFASGLYLHSKMHCCDWEEIGKNFREISDGIDAGKAVSTPFSLLATPATLAQQKRCAEIWVQQKFPAPLASPGANGKHAHDKIRLGYFSSDFYNHATAYLMAELLERHDRSRFEVIGFSFGASPDDAMRRRVGAAFDRFIDVDNQSDRDIAALSMSLEIDIAIDLKGFTEGARTGIFALRPAPIQVNYLGYPGTMSAPYIDYLIADPTLIPIEHRHHYTEKIAYLPDTYQVNDSQRRISERQFTRNEAGLPDEGFVFCCFNNNFKIMPAVFDIWMQLLKRVEGSVLWLFEGNAQAGENLRNEAEKRGIAPERIVFAKRMDLPDHLARHRLADLFLDTFFYNAHTTASDALWAGLPVLTCLGETFAGRVAASLLNAIGLPELIAHSHEEYEALALELASNPEKLSRIKQQLAKNRVTHPLFDTARFTRHIEDVFIQMWQKHQDALLPDHIYVAPN